MIGRWRVFMGFVAGAVYAYFAHAASWGWLAAGMALALAGLLLRGWAAGYLEKGVRLAQDGPYAFIRHPLYAGSFLMALGFCVAGTDPSRPYHAPFVWGTFFLLFFWVYPKRIREEEGSLEKHFGQAWREFIGRRHRFIPRLSPIRRPDADRFSSARYKDNREYNAALGWLAGLGFVVAKFLVERS